MSTPSSSPTEAPPRRLFGLEGPSSLLVACLAGALVGSLYNTMVNVALPAIGQHFLVPLTDVQWVVLVYLLTTSSTIVVSGRLCDMFGARRVYRWGLGVFAFGALLCSLAPSLLTLLIARPFQGLGASMFIAAVPAILTGAFPDRQRGRVLGIYGTAIFVGLSTGPLLGGLLTQFIDWRAVFAAPIALALAALWLAWRYVPPTGSTERGRGFDLWGSLAYVGILASLLLALSRARQWGLGSPQVLALLGLCVLLAFVFIRVERRVPTPLVDLQLFSSRYFSLSLLAPLTLFIAMYSVSFLLPFYLVQARGFSAGLAGLLISTQPLCMMFTASLVGVLSDRFGPRAVATLGAVILAGGLALLAQIGAETPIWYIVLALVILGGGFSLCDVANNSALMGAVPRSRRGLASGTVATSRYVGQSMGVALASTIFALVVGEDVGPNSWAGFSTAFGVMAGIAAFSAVLSAARGTEPTSATLERGT